MASIAKVCIYDTLGIREVEFTAGRWNEITGGNGEGKTSILEAIKAVFEGGNDASLIRAGCDRAEQVIVLDDGHTIRKRVGKGAGLSIEKDGVKLKEPQKTLNGWRDMISVNPVEFLTAPAKKRVDVLLETMPMQADPERIRTIIGQADFEVKGDHALEQLKAAYDDVYATRTVTNRMVKEKESTINQLAATLPAPGEGPQGSEAELEEELKKLDDAQEAEMQRIDTKLGGMKAAHDAEVEAIRQQIADLQASLSAKVQAFAETSGRAQTQRGISTSRWRETRQPIAVQLDVIRENRAAASRADGTRATIKTLREEVTKLERDSTAQTKALEEIVAYKAELLSKLPIPGLEVKDGNLFQGGVPFERINKAQQARIAIEIAKLRAGDLRVVCVDDLEMLDAEHREELIRLAAENDLQFFVTRVNDQGGDLTITAQ